MHKILTQFKREFWESHASLIRTPLYLGVILTGLLLLGIVTAQRNIAKVMNGGGRVDVDIEGLDPEFLRLLFSGELFAVHPQILAMGLAAIYTVFFLVLLLVVQAYLLSSLYADRRDQSILFWKSLPVTERQNVLTKLATALVAAPLAYALAAIATGIAYLLALMVYGALVLNVPLPGFGPVLSAFGSSAVRLTMAWFLLALWALPVFAWLMLASALAKKAPSLLALGLPLAAVVLEVWVLGTTALGGAITSQLREAITAFVAVMQPSGDIGYHLATSLSTPALLWGLVISALMISASIWLRNYRYEI